MRKWYHKVITPIAWLLTAAFSLIILAIIYIRYKQVEKKFLKTIDYLDETTIS
jgi:hypothetical protein